MSKISTPLARLCAIVGATLSLAAHAGDITPESLALMAAPWGGAKAAMPATRIAQPAKAAPAAEQAAAADAPYDYDAPAGGWHVPGTPIRPARVTVARR